MSSIAPNSVLFGKAHDLTASLSDVSIKLVVTSPPYAEQRKDHYDSVSEEEYPDWMAALLKALWPKVADDGSVFINIREHLRDGQLSDYVLRTRLAIRATGWNEAEKLIWYKPDAPPLGSLLRPRRAYEEILWYSKRPNPYMNLLASGNANGKVGFGGSNRFNENENGGGVVLHDGNNFRRMDGVSRITDVIVANVGDIPKGIPHGAMYPPTLPEQLIETFSQEGDVVLDPFVGSGTTVLVADKLNRRYIGFDNCQEFVTMTLERLAGNYKDLIKLKRDRTDNQMTLNFNLTDMFAEEDC